MGSDMPQRRAKQMDPNLDAIADLLGVEDQAARRFVAEVRRSAGGEGPDLATIAEYLRENQDRDLDPEEMLAIINRALANRPTSTGAPLSARPADRSPEFDDPIVPLPSPIPRHDPRQNDGTDKCKHGVLKGRPCHICRRNLATHDG
jgi:hypothetical protein